MAWKEQCKIAFRSNVSKMLLRERRKHGAITRILKKLHKESGIPYRTLRNWYYEEINNELQNSNCPENGTNGAEVIDYSKLLCLECRKYPIYLTASGRPVGEVSKYYGLCESCKKYKSTLISLDNIKHNSEGIETVCPNCHQIHLINKKRLKGVKK